MYVCMYVCMYACMYVCMYVCMFVSMFVCMYVMLLLLDALHLGRQTSTTPWSGYLFYIFELHPIITLSTNNQITLCSYYNCPVQLPTMLCEQLRTIIDNAMFLLFYCPELRYTRHSVTTRYYNCQYYRINSRVGKKQSRC